MDWKVIALLAGVLPLDLALDKSGAAQLFVDHTLRRAGQAGSTALRAVLYLLTVVLTSLMSNHAAAVLLAPLAIVMAAKLGLNAKPLLVAATFAASTCFATPVGYQTNTMVYNAGGYRFSDSQKVGVPLNLLFWAWSVYYFPKFWPFSCGETRCASAFR